MEEIIEFTLFPKREDLRGGRANDLATEVFEKCREKWPDHASKTAFNFRGRVDACETKEVLEFLEYHGMTPNWKRHPKVKYSEPDRFQLQGKRYFSEMDLDASLLLVAVPTFEIAESASHREDGSLSIDSSTIVEGLSLGRALGSSHLVCDESMKAKLECENLHGLNFVRVQVTASDHHFFKIGSACELPPTVSPLIDQNGEPFHESSSACHIDDLFIPPILSYDIQSFNLVESFDIALTNEFFGAGRRSSWEQKTIVSQRFRSVADRLGLQIDYTPVRIE